MILNRIILIFSLLQISILSNCRSGDIEHKSIDEMSFTLSRIIILEGSTEGRFVTTETDSANSKVCKVRKFDVEGCKNGELVRLGKVESNGVSDLVTKYGGDLDSLIELVKNNNFSEIETKLGVTNSRSFGVSLSLNWRLFISQPTMQVVTFSISESVEQEGCIDHAKIYIWKVSE